MILELLNKFNNWLWPKPVVKKRPPPLPPEYNIPIETLPAKYYDIIRADVRFTDEERKIIRQALEEWNFFCNGFLELEVKFDYNKHTKFLPGRVIMHRANQKDAPIKSFEKENKAEILGLCDYTKNTGMDLYILSDKLPNMDHHRMVVMHEIGHYLWLKHQEGRAIMNKCCPHDTISLTHIDAIEFARVYQLDPETLKYQI